jgi:hypothetical protein
MAVNFSKPIISNSHLFEVITCCTHTKLPTPPDAPWLRPW